MKSKRFKLQLDDGTIKTGVISNEILESGTFELPKIYDATIDVEKYIDDNQKVLKEKYYLKGLFSSQKYPMQSNLLAVSVAVPFWVKSSFVIYDYHT